MFCYFSRASQQWAFAMTTGLASMKYDKRREQERVCVREREKLKDVNKIVEKFTFMLCSR